MAKLLYRLGFVSAKRAWVVITTWILILGFTVSAMVLGGAKLSSNITIKGIASQKVIDQLKQNFASASGGSAQIVFHRTAGGAFTDAEKSAITESLNQVAMVPGVSKAINPFTTQTDLEKKRADVAKGIRQVATGKTKLVDAQKKINDGLAALPAAKTKLDKAEADLKVQSAKLEAGIAAMKAQGAPASMLEPLLANRAKIAAGFAQIKAGRKSLANGAAQLAAAQVKLDKAKAKLTNNEPKLKYAQQLLATSANFGTVSKDGATALANIQFKLPINQVDKASLKQIVSLVSDNKIEGVTVDVSKEFVNDISGLLGAGEIIGLVVAAIVLFVLLGALVAAGLPVLSALLGVGISATATMAIASVVDMDSTTPILGVMLGLAVGIDYSLFILNRHIRQLKAGVEVRESIGLATGTSGNAVVFAGLTVIIALAALNLTGIAFLGLMGTMGALAIVVAVLIAVTFTPAMLGVLGLKVLSRKARRKLAAGELAAAAPSESAPVEGKKAKKDLWVNRHPWISVLAGVLALVIVALPSASMRLGLPDGSSEPTDSTQYRAFKETTDAFGAGFNGGIIAVATVPAALSADDKLKLQADTATKLFGMRDVAAVLPVGVSDDGKTYVYEVVPTYGPASVQTEKLVYAIRGLSNDFKSQFNSTLGVTGLTASNIDVSKKLADSLPLYLGTILILSMLLLLLVFRSIAVPILASAGFLATIFATMGGITAVFQWGWLGSLFGVHDPGPILSFLPTIMIGILFGLAMDYQLFLTSGIREAYAHGKSPRESINYGIRLSRSVVVAAAIIMISVFGGFAFSHLAMIRPLGYGLASGVLFDAFVVRLILVPSAMSILGKAAWWLPKWLDRLLPNVDVEGEALEREHLH